MWKGGQSKYKKK